MISGLNLGFDNLVVMYKQKLSFQSICFPTAHNAIVVQVEALGGFHAFDLNTVLQLTLQRKNAQDVLTQCYNFLPILYG